MTQNVLSVLSWSFSWCTTFGSNSFLDFQNSHDHVMTFLLVWTNYWSLNKLLNCLCFEMPWCCCDVMVTILIGCFRNSCFYPMTGQPSSVIWLPSTLVITFHVSLSSVSLTINRKPLGQQTPMTTDKDTSCYRPLYLHWHWSITSQETMWQTCFTKRQWACNWILWKLSNSLHYHFDSI